MVLTSLILLPYCLTTSAFVKIHIFSFNCLASYNFLRYHMSNSKSEVLGVLYRRFSSQSCDHEDTYGLSDASVPTATLGEDNPTLEKGKPLFISLEYRCSDMSGCDNRASLN